ncbi:MAG: class I SAM-dependent methyltransferase [Alphaproteobacteria bacterium]|nr:class I SAM-dependent methyltransferase [Alphaproteobacteria bacterium]MCD8566775.1 class I SAM-dependent methyltransferase [Alphaproteobacteria bacterium]
MKTVWDDPQYVSEWNQTYGLDMRNAQARADLFFPLFAERVGNFEEKTFMDFGCGNGNLIRVFQQESFGRWIGIDRGSAVIESARNSVQDPRVQFVEADITQTGTLTLPTQNADIVTSVFVAEELPQEGLQAHFINMREAVGENGKVILFCNHPAYAMYHDWTAFMQEQPNQKFENHSGYFDRVPTTFALGKLNQDQGYVAKPQYFHKTVADIFNAARSAGLNVDYMLEIPASDIHWPPQKTNTQSGDYPRFLYLELKR